MVAVGGRAARGGHSKLRRALGRDPRQSVTRENREADHQPAEEPVQRDAVQGRERRARRETESAPAAQRGGDSQNSRSFAPRRRRRRARKLGRDSTGVPSEPKRVVPGPTVERSAPARSRGVRAVPGTGRASAAGERRARRNRAHRHDQRQLPRPQRVHPRPEESEARPRQRRRRRTRQVPPLAVRGRPRRRGRVTTRRGVVSGEKGVRDARLPPASRARRKRTRHRRRPRALRPAGGLTRPRGEPRVWAVRERRRAFVAGGGGDAARDGSRALFALEGPRGAPVAPEGFRGDARRAGPGQPEQPERGAHAQQGGGLRAGGSARHGQRRRRRRFARDLVGAARPGSAEPRGYVRGEGDAGPRGARRG